MAKPLTNSGGNSTVHFEEIHHEEQKTEERRKFLTMKYGQHQIKLIQKRLKFEFWVDDELTNLYNVKDPNATYPCELDIDELLDLESESDQRQHIKELVSDCGRSEAVIKDFITRVLEKLATL